MGLGSEQLLASRRFLPFFLTQALGAFNDNLFKQAIVLAILFKLALTQSALGVLGPDVLVNLGALLFILPFFLFSALGGQLGEALPKATFIQRLKAFEILLMLAGGYAIWAEALVWLLLILFLMGLQSALFGPVKYAILPEYLAANELMAGNAWVELGTFLAILTGTLTAGLLLAQSAYGVWVAMVVIGVALLGWWSSLFIPKAAASGQFTPVDWHLWRQSKAILALGFSQERTVRYGLLANAWFWFLGATYLTQIPNFAKLWLKGDEAVVSLILTLFAVGIATGSLVCAKLSRGKIEPVWVAVGALGLSAAGGLLYWHAQGLDLLAAMPWWEHFSRPSAWVLLDIFALGVFGGIYIVPLYALIQARTKAHERTRVIAANNILNALFMVLAALLAMLLLGVLGLDIVELFGLVALSGGLVNGWLFYQAPEYLRR